MLVRFVVALLAICAVVSAQFPKTLPIPADDVQSQTVINGRLVVLSYTEETDTARILHNECDACEWIEKTMVVPPHQTINAHIHALPAVPDTAVIVYDGAVTTPGTLYLYNLKTNTVSDPINKTSMWREDYQTVVFGNKVLLVGGIEESGDQSRRVDQISFAADGVASASHMELSVARNNLVTVVSQGQDVFALSAPTAFLVGGYLDADGDQASNMVDWVQDASLNAKGALALNMPWADMAAVATSDNKIVLAGGIINVDNEWRVTDQVAVIKRTAVADWGLTYFKLSQARTNIVGALIGSTVVFAGGNVPAATSDQIAHSSVVDILNTATMTFSTGSPLSVPKSNFQAATIGNLVVFAGGVSNDGKATASVDIFDVQTRAVGTARLSQAVFWDEEGDWSFNLNDESIAIVGGESGSEDDNTQTFFVDYLARSYLNLAALTQAALDTAGSVSQLDSKVQAVEGAVAAQTSEVEQLSDKIVGVDAQLGVITTQVHDVNTSFATVRSDVAAVKEAVAAQTSQVEQLSDKIVGVDAQLGVITTQVQDVNASLATVRSDVTGTVDELKGQVSSLQKVVKELQAKLDQLNPKCLETQTKSVFSTASSDANDICGGGSNDDNGSKGSSKVAVYAGVGAAIGVVLLGAAFIIYRRNKSRTIALDQAMLLEHQSVN